ncbi:hypothetical protein BC830DRAFT_1081864 [Chytriomyces sp. MP71]|nr:hypothetical protein BC830DRAFT_1081864 [Chytriomyces sp. MP71]
MYQMSKILAHYELTNTQGDGNCFWKAVALSWNSQTVSAVMPLLVNIDFTGGIISRLSSHAYLRTSWLIIHNAKIPFDWNDDGDSDEEFVPDFSEDEIEEGFCSQMIPDFYSDNETEEARDYHCRRLQLFTKAIKIQIVAGNTDVKAGNAGIPVNVIIHDFSFNLQVCEFAKILSPRKRKIVERNRLEQLKVDDIKYKFNTPCPHSQYYRLKREFQLDRQGKFPVLQPMLVCLMLCVSHILRALKRRSFSALTLLRSLASISDLSEGASDVQDRWLHQHVDIDKADLVQQSRNWKAKFEGQAQEKREQLMKTPATLASNRDKRKVPRDVQIFGRNSRLWSMPENLITVVQAWWFLWRMAHLLSIIRIDGDGNYELSNDAALGTIESRQKKPLGIQENYELGTIPCKLKVQQYSIGSLNYLKTLNGRRMANAEKEN